MKTGAEKRSNERFQAKRGVFATLHSDSGKIGQIINISRGGLTFRYFTNGDQSKNLDESGVFLSNGKEYLKNIPLKIVSDFVIDRNDSNSVRQCCAQFGEMTIEQEIMLDSFLWSNVKI